MSYSYSTPGQPGYEASLHLTQRSYYPRAYRCTLYQFEAGTPAWLTPEEDRRSLWLSCCG